MSATPDPAPSDGQPLRRVTRASTGSWHAACRDDHCIAQVLFQLPVTIPATPATVDAVLSVTLDYKTTRGDIGSVGAGYMVEGETRARRMRPGSFRISSPSPRVFTTSTLTWVKDGLESGRTYTFSVGLVSKDLGRSGPEKVAGTKAVAVLEIWAEAPDLHP
jgi:hypothetical protein